MQRHRTPVKQITHVHHLPSNVHPAHHRAVHNSICIHSLVYSLDLLRGSISTVTKLLEAFTFFEVGEQKAVPAKIIGSLKEWPEASASAFEDQYTSLHTRYVARVPSASFQIYVQVWWGIFVAVPPYYVTSPHQLHLCNYQASIQVHQWDQFDLNYYLRLTLNYCVLFRFSNSWHCERYKQVHFLSEWPNGPLLSVHHDFQATRGKDDLPCL